MRKVAEWIGKTDDTPPPASVKRRLLEKYDNKCGISGIEFRAGDKIEFDHIQPLWLGGENRENNLQPALATKHKDKTKTEAKVRSKVNRVKTKHHGLKQKKPWSKFKKKMNGEVVLR